MDPTTSSKEGFVAKFAGAFTCHSMSLKKDKKRPMLDGSSPESELLCPPTGVKKIVADYQKGLSFVDILKPTSRSDLLVQPKKLGEIEHWLNCMFGKRSDRPELFLIISGPSGSGKLTTLKFLAQERGIEIIEFVEVNYIKDIFSVENDTHNSYREHLNNRTQNENIRNFLIQANGTSIVNKIPKNRRLIVLKDLPSTLTIEPEKYQKLWTWYYDKFSEEGVPVVFILSNDPGREQVKIFSNQIRTLLNVSEIQFNPLVKSRIVPWLTDKLEKKISKPEIEAIVDEGKGDIRNILNCFELKFSQTLSKQRPYVSSKRNVKKPRTENYSFKGSESRAIWGRDLSLELYHFLGKILFCKRNFEKPMRKTLPDSLTQFERHPLNEDPFQLYESFVLSSSNLNLFLHQNYLHYAENLESAANCLAWLSQADCIRDDVFDSDSPLENYQSCLAVAGLMFNLSPNGPVKVHLFENRRNKTGYDARRSTISSNRAWHLNQEKIKETKSTLKHAFNDKSTSLISQDLILDILPYTSVMNVSRKKFTPDLLAISCFPHINSGGFNRSQELFSARQSSVQFAKENSTLEMDNPEESDEESHYIIEEDSD